MAGTIANMTQNQSLSHLTSDPLRNFKFQIIITSATGGTVSLGFMSASGLNVTNSVIAYREGSMNTVTRKLPGQSDFSPIVLSRGVAVGSQWDIEWLSELFTVMQGTGSNNGSTDFRRTVDIQIATSPVTTASATIPAAFRVYNAWPTAVAYSDLDAGANQLFISQMTLAHEGWDYHLSNTYNTSAEGF